MRKLQDILAGLPFETLPPAWTTFDLAAFSRSKRLFDYQQEALEYALRALWKYYQDFADYAPDEAETVNAERKRRLYQWYLDNGLEADLDIRLERQKRDVRRLLADYYPLRDGRVAYAHLVNRMGFWMATGSGKTLVLVKLIELLWRLIQRGEIPPHDILVLTHRDDLLAQLRAHVDEFNAARGDLFIRLHDLRQYPDVKRRGALFREQEIPVFYYRSDNLSDEQKERIVDFHNYENNGRWYILLDEAHKGDKEDSRRQHIYSILSRHGFLFNFSATFTDERDILTTACDFNLTRFIEAGYGKHVSILKQENRAFGDKEDYMGAEKQKIVLKALLMLTYAWRARQAVLQAAGRGGVYHKPLLLTLVNSVNIRDADLKLFLRELERIGKGGIDHAAWRQAKAELWQELAEGPELVFEDSRFQADEKAFAALSPQDVLECAFNAPGPGEMEVWLRPSNRQEMAFKLKSAERPFALIRIGDISGWLKEELEGYAVIEGFQDESFFERLNRDDSDITMLLGSRSFYEGWDSNRPNVITFVNIGVGTEARKFILQSVGRGVRIEPLPGQRKRLQSLYNAGLGEAQPLYLAIREKVLPLETLFIFGTNRQAMQTVIAQLDLEKGKETVHELALEINQAAMDDHLLLVPTYRGSERPLVEQRATRKFEIAASELALLTSYVDHLGDDRLLLTLHGATPKAVRLLRYSLADPIAHFNMSNGRRYGHVELMLSRLFDYFQVIPQEVDGLKPLADEIRHFRQIKVFLRDIRQLQQEIERVKRYPQRPALEAQLRRQYEAHQLSFDDLFAGMKKLQGMARESQVTYRASTLDIRYIANHYYVPVILSHDERVDYIRHIIHHPSEVRFVDALEDYVQQSASLFGQFDWWLFSKLDETLDDVYLPYYDPNANRIRQFKPDFIFWMQKGDEYSIAFVDPKGMQHGDYQRKVDDYAALFLEGNGRAHVWGYNRLRVRVYLFLYTQDANRAPAEYAACWYDHPQTLVQRVLNETRGAI